nr:MAG TPA: Protein of unknown function (DUF5131) [Caudoviricetes sp.]
MTKIEWTNETWNPITGCCKKSEGCLNCYAEKMHKRLTAMGQEKYKFPFENVVFHYEELSRKLSNKPKMFFVNSMSDTFNEKISGEQILKILTFCEKYPQHIFQILTKRAERVGGFLYPENVWLGVTVEKAKYKNRIDYLRKTNAKIKFLSCEPLLEDLGELDLSGIDWVICGGETGSKARPMHPDWVRNIQRQCKEQNVSFFFKQWGEWRPICKNEYVPFPAEKKIINGKVILFSGFTIDGIYPKDIEEFEKITEINVEESKGNIVLKLGKTKSGALLDGKEYKEFPNYIVGIKKTEAAE